MHTLYIHTYSYYSERLQITKWLKSSPSQPSYFLRMFKKRYTTSVIVSFWSILSLHLTKTGKPFHSPHLCEWFWRHLIKSQVKTVRMSLQSRVHKALQMVSLPRQMINLWNNNVPVHSLLTKHTWVKGNPLRHKFVCRAWEQMVT